MANGLHPPKELPSIEVLRSFFTYDPESGIIRWNLRLATISENARNMRRKSSCTLPRGVKRHHRGNTFEANIRISPKKRIRIGSFPTAELAHAAYCEAAKKYHGEFARFD